MDGWQDDFVTDVVAATVAAIDVVNDSYDDCYAAVIVCDNGYTGYRLAVNTQDHVDRSYAPFADNGLCTRSTFEVSCGEFCHYEWEPFESVSRRGWDLVRAVSSGDLTVSGTSDISLQLRTALIRAIGLSGIPSRLRTSYTGELLTGIGFADPSGPSEVQDVVAVSSVVNSESWHQKVVTVADAMR